MLVPTWLSCYKRSCSGAGCGTLYSPSNGQRNTYNSRISELRRLGLTTPAAGKALPQRPPSGESFAADTASPPASNEEKPSGDEDIYVIGTSTATQINKPSQASVTSVPRFHIPPRQQSLPSSSLNEDNNHGAQPNLRSHSDLPQGETLELPYSLLESDGSDLPNTDFSFHNHPQFPEPENLTSPFSTPNHRAENITNESTSWLDTIDESGASSVSSGRSRTPSVELRQHNRSVSGEAEGEFDANVDAVVDTAYHSKCDSSDNTMGYTLDEDVVSNVRRNVELAKQKVREAEMEAEAVSARERESRRIQEETLHGDYTALDSNYDDQEAEEEERILEEMMDDFVFDLQSKSALPRQSGSSGFSSRTWGSSVTSNRTNPIASLSTLDEEDSVWEPAAVGSNAHFAHLSATPSSMLPPPPARIPPHTPKSTLILASNEGRNDMSHTPSVRSRRLSGKNAEQLMVATGVSSPGDIESDPIAQVPASPDNPASITLAGKTIEDSLPIEYLGDPGTKASAPHSRIDDMGLSSTQPVPIEPPTMAPSNNANRSTDPERVLPSHFDALSKTPSTPNSLQRDTLSSNSQSLPTAPAYREDLGSPPRSAFLSEIGKTHSFPSFPSVAGTSNSGLHIFDSSIHSPNTPGSPNTSASNPPSPLEPCPQSFLLRPFWLMRCLNQTIVHPNGGYLTTRLFIPKDVWRVKNVKIKALDEKISNCDLLTAALLKLAQVDTHDADAVLEEMQSFENILDQVQAVWVKKLGNEVGVQAGAALFKGSTYDENSPVNDPPLSKFQSGGGKSYFNSWRKLRSKSSGPNISNSGPKEGIKDALTMNSLPMTGTLSPRVMKRTTSQFQYTGPNSSYMSSLARLFDAAQVLGRPFVSFLSSPPPLHIILYSK